MTRASHKYLDATSWLSLSRFPKNFILLRYVACAKNLISLVIPCCHVCTAEFRPLRKSISRGTLELWCGMKDIDSPWYVYNAMSTVLSLSLILSLSLSLYLSLSFCSPTAEQPPLLYPSLINLILEIHYNRTRQISDWTDDPFTFCRLLPLRILHRITKHLPSLPSLPLSSLALLPAKV